MKINTQWDSTPHQKEIIEGPSLTVPDQTISIPEMIRRYASGLPLGGMRDPIFDEEPEKDILNGRPWASFDLSEQHDIVNQNLKDYNETIQRLRNYEQQDKTDIQTQQLLQSEEINKTTE